MKEDLTMTYEFMIRDIKTKEDLYMIKKVPQERFEAVKKEYEKALTRVNNNKNYYRGEYVLLINQCDDYGEFETVIQ